jgi:hypothetical protein
MSADDEYSAVIDQAVADAVRALLVAPHASPEAAHRLRQVTSWLGDTHGPDAVRDLAEALAGDMAELLGAFAEANHGDPLIVLDEWTHDLPLPPGAIDDQPGPANDPSYPNPP